MTFGEKVREMRRQAMMSQTELGALVGLNQSDISQIETDRLNPTDAEIARLKAANIKVANMDDAEKTAAIFMTPSNAYDPEEFELRNANLEDVSPDMPEHEKMAAITFGGWDF